MTWIQTFSGKKFSLVDPQPEDVDLADIIASLNNIVRFTGHCDGRYTVLQHSIHVAELCPGDLQLWGLLHDAPEAYYGDISLPEKEVLHTLSGGRFKEWTTRIDAVVYDALGLTGKEPSEVKLADNVMLATEQRDLMVEPPEPWIALPAPRPERIHVWSPEYTRFRWEAAYETAKLFCGRQNWAVVA